jgi:hypothetical protein
MGWFVGCLTYPQLSLSQSLAHSLTDTSAACFMPFCFLQYHLRMAAMGWFVGCLTYSQLSITPPLFFYTHRTSHNTSACSHSYLHTHVLHVC